MYYLSQFISPNNKTRISTHFNSLQISSFLCFFAKDQWFVYLFQLCKPNKREQALAPCSKQNAH